MESPEEPVAHLEEGSPRANKSALFFTLSTLPKDPAGSGFSHLGMDGVWRNVDKGGNVISYRGLSPEEIAEVLNVFPPEMREEFAEKLEGVDGRNVTDEEQLMHPGRDLLPNFKEDEGVDGRTG